MFENSTFKQNTYCCYMTPDLYFIKDEYCYFQLNSCVNQ